MSALDDAAEAIHDYRQSDREPGRGRRRGRGGATEADRWRHPLGRREIEGAGIFLAHGVADGLTTALAASTLGASGEANPVVQWILVRGVGVTVLVMVLIAGIVGLAYPRLAAWGEFPGWFAPLLVAVGLSASVGNLVAVALA